MKTLIEKNIEGLLIEELKTLLSEKESALSFLYEHKINKTMQKILKYEIKKIKAKL